MTCAPVIVNESYTRSSTHEFGYEEVEYLYTYDPAKMESKVTLVQMFAKDGGESYLWGEFFV